MIEIERKFLVKEPPLDYLSWKCITIQQGYLAFGSDNSEVRIRSLDKKYYQTVKTGFGLTRSEIEIEITEQQFKTLWPATEGKRVIKNRYLKNQNSHLIELDIYEEKLSGLIIVEVEFSSEKESEEFSPPSWFDREITNDPNYTSRKVAY